MKSSMGLGSISNKATMVTATAKIRTLPVSCDYIGSYVGGFGVNLDPPSTL